MDLRVVDSCHVCARLVVPGCPLGGVAQVCVCVCVCVFDCWLSSGGGGTGVCVCLTAKPQVTLVCGHCQEKWKRLCGTTFSRSPSWWVTHSLTCSGPVLSDIVSYAL